MLIKVSAEPYGLKDRESSSEEKIFITWFEITYGNNLNSLQVMTKNCRRLVQQQTFYFSIFYLKVFNVVYEELNMLMGQGNIPIITYSCRDSHKIFFTLKFNFLLLTFLDNEIGANSFVKIEEVQRFLPRCHIYVPVQSCDANWKENNLCKIFATQSKIFKIYGKVNIM